MMAVGLKIRHYFGSKLGSVSAETCLRNGCEEYCGNSPSQLMAFYSAKLKEIDWVGESSEKGGN